MGRQVTFYAAPQDIDTLVVELRKRGSVVIATRSPTPEAVVFRDELPLLDNEISAWLVREEDLPGLQWMQVPKFDHWVIRAHLMEELAVQFHGPGRKGKRHV